MDVNELLCIEDNREATLGLTGLGDSYSRKKQLQYAINILEKSTVVLSRDVADWVCSFFTPDEILNFLKKEFNTSKDRLKLVEDIDDLMRLFTDQWNKAGKETSKHDAVIKTLKRKLKNWKDEESLLQMKLAELQDVFKLSELETECLLFCYLKDHEPMFEDALCDFSRRSRRMTKACVKILSVMLNKSVFELTDALQSGGSLNKFGLLDEDLDLTPHISGFLNGLNGKAITSQFFSLFEGDALPLDYHSSLGDHIDILKSLLAAFSPNRGRHILLYGKPGTGKTSLVRSLASELNKSLYEINLEGNGSSSGSKDLRISALYACENTVHLEGSIILVDEADTMLGAGNDFLAMFFGGSTKKKGLVNEFIDRSNATCIWITNHFNGIDESILRRFDYSIEFHAPTVKQRILTWERCMEHHNLTGIFKADEIRDLATRYQVSAGGINLALKNLATVRDNYTSPVKAAEAILKQHSSLMNINKVNDTVKPVKNYSLKGLNIKTETSLKDCLSILNEFNTYLSDTPDPDIRNMNLLLYGPPGTGKTEFAKYVADKVGKPLMIKRASDLLDMYVGQTEKMIRAIFKQAEAEQAILFLDEADSLLQGREHAVRGWEVSQVNEVLVGMEQFKGILICSTNFQERLDTASLRRFNLKVGFDYLDNDGKIQFWNLYLKQILDKPLRGRDRQQLLKIGPLMPGDFKVVWQKYAFFPKAELTAGRILKALTNEVTHRAGSSNAIGFSQ